MPARYRRLCQSLALAADRRYSPALVDRLNELALRGHHTLYRNRGRQGQRVAEFLLGGFPALVRQEWRLVAAAAALFFGPLLALIAVLQAFPEFVHYLLSPEQIASFHEMYDPASKRLGMTSTLRYEMFRNSAIRNAAAPSTGGEMMAPNPPAASRPPAASLP